MCSSRREAGHAWAEAHVDRLGWVGFDPATNICPTDAHVRVAIGLDYLGAAPVRGARYGGGGESLDVRIDVCEKVQRRQTQRQAQS
jgi:transglutaminase-like putative cysteine protease